MRLISFQHKGVARYGMVEGDGIVDLTHRLGAEFPTLKSYLAGNGRPKAERLMHRGRADHPLSEVSFLPVVPDPDKIICVGINYDAHRLETGRAKVAYPTLFVRWPSSQVGHEHALMKPKESEQLDFEGEIAIVIGKAGRRIPRERAFDYIAGFSCYHDGSVRDFQRHASQFTPGKNFPATGGFGPWLVTRDEIEKPESLSLVTRLNGVEMQRATAAEMIFFFDAIVSYCSIFTELAPGDVIATGTPSGVGSVRTPPVFMKPGDVAEVEVSGVGVLRNPVTEG